MEYLRPYLKSIIIILGIWTGIIICLSSIYLYSRISDEDNSRYYVRVLPEGKSNKDKVQTHLPLIFQIDIRGDIGSHHLKISSIREQLQLLEKQFGHKVKGILLNFDTYGGTVIDSDGIYSLLKEYKAKHQIPIYAYIDGWCVSGGLYIAAAADQIYATNVSVIGSVGVVAPTFYNFSKLMQSWGIDSITLTAGKDKDILNPFRPWKEAEGENVQEIINYYYSRFIAILVNNRPRLTEKALIQDCCAKIFNADSAIKIGYIDKCENNRSKVYEALAEASHIQNQDYQVIVLERKNGLPSFSRIYEEYISENLLSKMNFSSELSGKFLYRYPL